MHERFTGGSKITNLFRLKTSKTLKSILNWLLNNASITCALREIFDWVNITLWMVYFMNLADLKFKILNFYIISRQSISCSYRNTVTVFKREKKSQVFSSENKETYLLVILLKPKSVLAILKWQQQLERTWFKSLPVK